MGRYGQKSLGRKEKTKQKMEEKVDGKAPGDEGAKTKRCGGWNWRVRRRSLKP